MVAFLRRRRAESRPSRGSCARSGPGITVRPAFLGRDACARGARLRARPLARLALEVARPLRRSLTTELVQVLPGVEPGVVPVVEDELHGVLPDRLDRRDADVLLAEHQYLLPGSVPLHFGGWGVHPQILERQLKAAAVGEAHFEHPRGAPQADLGGNEVGHKIETQYRQ